jgi:hypothetical protein
MKTLLFLLLLLPLCGIAQDSLNAPVYKIIKTKMSTRHFGRNKTLVIMPETQWKGVQVDFAGMRTEVSKVLAKQDSLEHLLKVSRERELLLEIQASVLRKAIVQQIRIKDSVQSKLDSVQRFWKETAVDGGFVSMNWKDTTIQILDMTCYSFNVNVFNGNFLMMRRGPNLFYKGYQRENWLNPDRRGNDWNFVLSPISKPKIIRYPHPDRFPLKNKFSK